MCSIEIKTILVDTFISQFQDNVGFCVVSAYLYAFSTFMSELIVLAQRILQNEEDHLQQNRLGGPKTERRGYATPSSAGWNKLWGHCHHGRMNIS